MELNYQNYVTSNLQTTLNTNSGETNILDFNIRDDRLIIPTLEEAYTNLMTTRDDNLYISPNEGGLTEEDVLCNTNLRTAKLFRGYSDELRKFQDEYKILIEDEDQISTSMKNFHSSTKTLRIQTQKHDVSSNDSLDARILITNKYLDTAVVVMMNEIQMKKSTLEAKIDTITKKLSTLRSLIQTGIEELIDRDSANNKKLCAICFDREVDTVMVPCGHTSCSGCSNYNTLNKCMHCRSSIQRRVKLFFSV